MITTDPKEMILLPGTDLTPFLALAVAESPRALREVAEQARGQR